MSVPIPSSSSSSSLSSINKSSQPFCPLKMVHSLQACIRIHYIDCFSISCCSRDPWIFRSPYNLVNQTFVIEGDFVVMVTINYLQNKWVLRIREHQSDFASRIMSGNCGPLSWSEAKKGRPTISDFL